MEVDVCVGVVCWYRDAARVTGGTELLLLCRPCGLHGTSPYRGGFCMHISMFPCYMVYMMYFVNGLCIYMPVCVRESACVLRLSSSGGITGSLVRAHALAPAVQCMPLDTVVHLPVNDGESPPAAAAAAA